MMGAMVETQTTVAPRAVIAAGNGAGAGAGPLVSGIDAIQAAAIAAFNPAGIARYVNRTMVAAEKAQPEGAEIQLDITGWPGPFGNSMAPSIADYLNRRFAAGKIVDPATQEAIIPWSAYPGQIAWGDAGTDTVTVRWVKGQYFIIAVSVAFALGIIAGIYIWRLLERSGWVASGSGSSAGGFAGLPFLEKAGIIGGGILLGLGVLWYYAELELRRAGASREQVFVQR